MPNLYVNKSGDDTIQAQYTNGVGTWDGVDTLSLDASDDISGAGITADMLIQLSSAADFSTGRQMTALVASVSTGGSPHTITIDATGDSIRGTNPAGATTWYWRVFTNHGRTAAKAMLSIGGACVARQDATAETGEVIVVQSGIYNETIAGLDYSGGNINADGHVIWDGDGVLDYATPAIGYYDGIEFTGFLIGVHTNTAEEAVDCVYHHTAGVRVKDAFRCEFKSLLKINAIDDCIVLTRKMIGCTCVDCYGSVDLSAAGIILLDNIVDNCGGTQNWWTNNDPAVADHNLYYSVPNEIFNTTSLTSSDPATVRAAGYEANGIFSSDPLFNDRTNGDFTLQYSSPALGAGFYGRQIGKYMSATSANPSRTSATWTVSSTEATGQHVGADAPTVYSGDGWFDVDWGGGGSQNFQLDGGAIKFLHTSGSHALRSPVFDMGLKTKIGNIAAAAVTGPPLSVWDYDKTDTEPNRMTLRIRYSDSPFYQDGSGGSPSAWLEVEIGEQPLSGGNPIYARYVQCEFTARDDGVEA